MTIIISFRSDDCSTQEEEELQCKSFVDKMISLNLSINQFNQEFSDRFTLSVVQISEHHKSPTNYVGPAFHLKEHGKASFNFPFSYLEKSPIPPQIFEQVFWAYINT